MLFRCVDGKFPWLFDEAIDIDEAFALFLPGAYFCQVPAHSKGFLAPAGSARKGFVTEAEKRLG